MKNFKKIISFLLVTCLFLSGTLPSAIASSDLPVVSVENKDEKQLQKEIEKAEKEMRKEIEKEISKLYGKETLEDIKSLGLGIEILQNGQIIVDLDLETTDFEAGFELDTLPESDTVVLNSTFVDETGKRDSKKIVAKVKENTNDTFKASLQDIETGEVYNIDTTELNASVLPIFVYVVAGIVIRTTSKHVLGIAIKNLTHKSFTSFSALKSFLGSPGTNRQWHHIVEQSQITKSGFSVTSVQNTRNIVSVDLQHHYRITGHYNSKPANLGGKTVREWLTGKSFDEQFEYGMKMIDELQ